MYSFRCHRRERARDGPSFLRSRRFLGHGAPIAPPLDRRREKARARPDLGMAAVGEATSPLVLCSATTPSRTAAIEDLIGEHRMPKSLWVFCLIARRRWRLRQAIHTARRRFPRLCRAAEGRVGRGQRDLRRLGPPETDPDRRASQRDLDKRLYGRGLVLEDEFTKENYPWPASSSPRW